MRHDTMTVRRHFHPGNRCDTLHLRSAFPPASWNPEKSHHALQDRHFRVSTHQNHRVSRKINTNEGQQGRSGVSTKFLNVTYATAIGAHLRGYSLLFEELPRRLLYRIAATST